MISTFAGGGGSSTGYRLAGGKILCINEFVQEARNTYTENYPSTPILPNDIKELTGQELLDAGHVKVGEVDILDGSPPCSAFSIAGSVVQGGGHSKGFGKTKNYSDGKKVENIEDLFFEFIRVAKDIQPKVIVGENVSGLLMGEAKNYYWRITNAFENIGFSTNPVTPIADNFGEITNNCEPFEFGPWNIKQWSASCDKLTKGWTFFSDELLNNKVNFLNGPFDENLVNNIINEWIDQIESSILEESATHSDATSFEKWKGSVDYLFSQLSFVRKSN